MPFFLNGEQNFTNICFAETKTNRTESFFFVLHTHLDRISKNLFGQPPPPFCNHFFPKRQIFYTPPLSHSGFPKTLGDLGRGRFTPHAQDPPHPLFAKPASSKVSGHTSGPTPKRPGPFHVMDQIQQDVFRPMRKRTGRKLKERALLGRSVPQC